MSETSKSLISHTCPSCAGRLNVDPTTKTYLCESCGNSYDYNYFLSEDIYEKARNAHLRKEFKSASSMYDFILMKNPAEFEAKVGRLFADNKICDFTDYEYSTLGKSPVKKDCSRYKNNASQNQIRFFDLFELNAEAGRRILERKRMSFADYGDDVNSEDRALIKNNILEMKKIFEGEVGRDI